MAKSVYNGISVFGKQLDIGRAFNGASGKVKRSRSRGVKLELKTTLRFASIKRNGRRADDYANNLQGKETIPEKAMCEILPQENSKAAAVTDFNNKLARLGVTREQWKAYKLAKEANPALELSTFKETM